MSIYAIGDIQGCFKTLKQLIKIVPFDPKKDQFWLTGDLVNRGPDSLKVLQWAQKSGLPIQTVLGNHDFHFLARSLNLVPPKKRDTLEEALQSSALSSLQDWMRQQPILHEKPPYYLIHGGIPPNWTLKEARLRAQELESGLQSQDWKKILKGIYTPSTQDPSPALERFRETVRCLTRIRMCRENGEPDFQYTGPPKDAPKEIKPWFEFPIRKNEKAILIFGHWSALGLYLSDKAVGLDTGCVWGRKITAIRLEDRTLYQVDYAEKFVPEGIDEGS